MVKMNPEKEESSPPESSNFIMVSPSTSHHSNGLNASFVCFQSLSTISDASVDLSLEEIQNKFKILVKENMDLKVTIQQNSTLMREQYSSLIKWREQMKENEILNIAKCEEAKQVVLQLRQDKKELAEKLRVLEEHLDQNNQSLVRENILLKNQLLEKEQENVALQTQCREKLDEEVNNKVMERNLLKNQLQEKEQEIVALQLQYREQQDEQAILVNVVPNEEIQQQLVSLEIKHKLSTEETEKYRIKIKRLEEEREELKKIMNGMVVELKDLQNDHDRLEQDNGDLIKTKNELKRKLEEVNSEMHKLCDAHQRMHLEKNDLIALNNDLSTQLENMKQNYCLAIKLDNSLKSYIHFEEPENKAAIAPLHYTTKAMSDLLIQLQEDRGKIAGLTSHITEQQATIEDLQKELRRKEENLDNSCSDKFTSIQHEAKVEELFSHLESLNCDIQQNCQPSVESSMAGDIQCLKHQVLSLVSELNESESKFKIIDASLVKYRNRCCDLEHRLTLFHDEMESLQTKDDALIDQLRVEINSMECRLNATKQQSDAYKKNLEELRDKYEKLCKDYGDMHQNLEIQEKIKCQEGGKSVSVEWMQERKSLIEKVDNLVARLISTEESFSNQKLEIKDLKTENDMLKKQVEIVPLLQAQVEVYRDDFQAERAARERIHADIEKFQEENQQLQLCNRQLHDELNMYSDNRLQEMQIRHGGDYVGAYTTGRQPAAEPITPTAYYCPKCMKAYTELEVLERHVDDCLNDENPFVM